MKRTYVAKSLLVVSEAVEIFKFQLFWGLDLGKICYVCIIFSEFQIHLQKEERGHLTYGQKNTKLKNENGSKNKDVVGRLRINNLSIWLDLMVNDWGPQL